MLFVARQADICALPRLWMGESVAGVTYPGKPGNRARRLVPPWAAPARNFGSGQAVTRNPAPSSAHYERPNKLRTRARGAAAMMYANGMGVQQEYARREVVDQSRGRRESPDGQ